MKKIKIIISGIASLALSLSLASRADAANFTWTDSGTGSFLTPANWGGAAAPGAGDTSILDTGKAVFNTGDSYTTTGSLNIGWFAPGANGTVEVDGGTLTVASIVSGQNSGQTGNYIQTGGTVNFTAASFNLAKAGTGIWNISGGTLNATSSIAQFSNGAGTATLNISGTAAVNLASMHLGQTSTGTGTLNVSGGTLTVNGGITVGAFASSNAAYGNITQTGGLIIATGIAGDHSTTGIDSTHNSFTANGGTVRASAANAAFFGTQGAISGIYMNLQGSGLTFDTNGFAVGINNNVHGVGGLTKSGGAGVLTLSGTNDYSGTTTANAGTILITGKVASTVLAATGGTIQFVGATTLTGGSPSLTLDANGGFADTLSAVSDGVTLSTLTVGSGGGTLDGDGTTNVTYTFGSTGSVFNGFLTLNSWDSVNDKLVFADTLNSTQLGDIILSGMIATGQDGSNAVVFAVPEPSELALLGLSGVLLFGMLRFRKVRAIA